MPGGISPISSRNSVPPSASSNRPFLSAIGVRERALHVPEELALEQRLGERAAVDGDERPCRRGPCVVERARDELLAGAALAGDQHGRIRLRELVHLLHQRLHRAAAGDQVTVVDVRAQLLHLGRKRAPFCRAPDRQQQPLGIDGLGEVVVGAALDRVNGVVDRAEGGGQHDLDVGIHALHVAQQAHAVVVTGHPHVADDHVDMP